MAHISSPKAKRLKTAFAMPKFCPFCTRAGIHEIGYVESSPGSIQLVDEGSDKDLAADRSLDLDMEDGNEDDMMESDVEEITEEEESDQSGEEYPSARRPQTLPNVKGSMDTCLLCKKIWSAFEKWATGKYGSPDRINLSTSGVTIWPTELSEKWRLYEEDASYGTYTGGTLSLLRVRISVQDPDDLEEWLEPEVKFQKCNERILSVADIFDTNNGHVGAHDPLSWPDAEPYIGRRRPLVADLRLFRKWKSFCDATHDGNCQPGRIPLGSRSLRFIRLIDVERCSIVEVENIETVSWVAISYVWGKKRFRTLTEATLEELKREGALKASWVPETIADAIAVTRGIGEKYLWTDSLCIIQDSDTDKMRFVPRMDIIYGRASLTIVNAAGDNAFSGLPGVRAGTRFQQEEPFSIGGEEDTDEEPTWIVQTSEPIRTSRELVGDSYWFTRGWTYQEAMLSQRWLIFTPEQVYWECRQATWREDACWELPQWRKKKQTVIYDPAFDSHLLQDLWNPSSAKSFDGTYQTLVVNYLKRNLTNESDGLDAIGGVLRAVTEVTGFEFLWGLPKEFFAVTVAWPCCLQRPHRRTGRCRIEVAQDKTVQACFPSWSWVGWVGEIWTEPSDFVGPTAGLEFYHIVSSDTGEDNPVLQHISHEEKPSQAAYEPSRWKDPVWRGNTGAEVSLKDIPAVLLVPETRFSLLVLWTSISELSFEKDTSSFVKGFDVEVSIVLADGIASMPWSDYYGQLGNVAAKENRSSSTFSQHHMLDITTNTIIARFYERQKTGGRGMEWKGTVCIEHDVWEGDFALVQKGSPPSSGDYENGLDPSLRRRLLEESWLGLVLGQSSDSGYGGSKRVYVLVVEEMPPSAICAVTHWERVGLLTIDHWALKSEKLERKNFRLA